MCGSDLHPYRASRSGGAAKSLGLGGAGGPCIAGHEPCGVVAERGPGVPEADAPTGARVMNHHYKGCGHCKHCRAGWAQLCPRGIVVYGMTGHGGHAPFMTVAGLDRWCPLPDELSFEEGAAISCGTGTAYQALRRLDVSGRDTLAVFGQGPVGLSATMLGVAMGARVVAVDVGGPSAASSGGSSAPTPSSIPAPRTSWRRSRRSPTARAWTPRSTARGSRTPASRPCGPRARGGGSASSGKATR